MVYSNDYDFMIQNCSINQQLGYCQAWQGVCEVIDEHTGEIVNALVLQSYNTIVAVMSFDGTMLELGKWSTTTSKQVTRFFRENGGQERYCLGRDKEVEGLKVGVR